MFLSYVDASFWFDTQVTNQLFSPIPRLLISSRERKRRKESVSLTPFVWRKRCWLTAELLDPTQPGFNADAWLMRSTRGIIIRPGILAFSCVSQDQKTSLCCGAKVSSFRLDHIYRSTTQSHIIGSLRWLLGLSRLWHLMEEGVMVGNLTVGPQPRLDTEDSTTYKWSPVRLLAVKCGRLNLAVFNPTIIIQQKVDFKLELEVCAEMY